MNNFQRTCKTTLLATLMMMAYGVHGAGGSGQSAAPDSASTSGASDSGTGMSGGQVTQGQDSAGTSGASGTQGSASAQSGGAGKSQGGQSGAGKQQASGHPPVFLLMPIEIASSDNTMRQGCWAKVYDRENYTGDSLTLVGPTALADMSGPYGLNWDDRVNSIEVGPKAAVTVFDNENFRDQVARFTPGQKVGDLSKRVGFFDEFASIKVDCPRG